MKNKIIKIKPTHLFFISVAFLFCGIFCGFLLGSVSERISCNKDIEFISSLKFHINETARWEYYSQFDNKNNITELWNNCCYPKECEGLYNNSGCNPNCVYPIMCYTIK